MVSYDPTRRGGAQVLSNFVGFFLFMQNYQILHGNIRGLFLDVQPSPIPRGEAQALPNLGGAFLLCVYTLWRKTTKFDMVTHMGKGLVFRGQPRPPPRGVESQRSPTLGVPFYSCVHCLSQNYQIWRGDTCRGDPCILGSATSHIPRQRSFSAHRYLEFCFYAYTV